MRFFLQILSHKSELARPQERQGNDGRKKACQRQAAGLDRPEHCVCGDEEYHSAYHHLQPDYLYWNLHKLNHICTTPKTRVSTAATAAAPAKI